MVLNPARVCPKPISFDIFHVIAKTLPDLTTYTEIGRFGLVSTG